MGVWPTEGIAGMAQGVTLTPTGSPGPMTHPRESPESSMRGTRIQRGTESTADPCRPGGDDDDDDDLIIEIQGQDE